MSKLSFGAAILRNWLSPRICKTNIAVTWRCNQQCLFCNIWQYNWEQKAQDEITAKEIKEILAKNHLFWVSLTGGEPFLNREIDDILDICACQAELISIVTNGTQPELIEKCIRRAIQEHSIVIISVSLEGNEEKHDGIVGVSGAYHRAVDTLERLTAIKSKNLFVNIEHLLSPQTSGQYIYLEQLALKLGINVTYTKEEISPYYHNEHSFLGNNYEMPKTVYGVSYMSILKKLYLSRLNKPSRCVAGEYSVFIDPYCNVYPCFMKAHQEKLINLHETNYYIGKLNLNKTLNSCRCWTPCESYTTILFRPWRLF